MTPTSYIAMIRATTTTILSLSAVVKCLSWQNLNMVPRTWNETFWKVSQIPNPLHTSSSALWVINNMSKRWILVCDMETEGHGPLVEGSYRALCMLLWSRCSQFLSLRLCSPSPFPRWPATRRCWAHGIYFADFRFWNISLDLYLTLLLFFPEWEVWKLCLPIPNGALDRRECLGSSIQAVLKGNWIPACLWHISYYINYTLQGIHWLPLSQEVLFFSFSLLMCKLAPSLLCWTFILFL